MNNESMHIRECRYKCFNIANNMGWGGGCSVCWWTGNNDFQYGISIETLDVLQEDEELVFIAF